MMLVRIKVKPNSKIESISTNSDGSIHVKIRALPVDGKANKYLIDFLAREFGLSKSCVEIVKGFNSQHKTIKLDAHETYVKDILRTFKSE